MAAVRSGVQVGAAALVLGFSIAGPQAIAVANADDQGTDTSTSSVAPARDSRGAASRAAKTATSRPSRPGETARTASARAVGEAASPRPAAAVGRRSVRSPNANVDTVATVPPKAAAVPTPAATPAAAVEPHAAAASKASVAADRQAIPMPIDGKSPLGPVKSLTLGIHASVERIDNAIFGALDTVSNWLAGLPSNAFTQFLQGGFLLVRRTFFDQPPTVHPVQTTGQTGGPITGTIGAVDPEGDPITYTVVDEPWDGSVVIKADGTYTYTPGTDFDGSDAFVVAATDERKWFSFNVLDPRRPDATEALATIKQGTDARVTFVFTYDEWKTEVKWDDNPEAMPALEFAAFQLAEAVDPQFSVTLTYQLGLTGGDTLGKASSPRTDRVEPGFFMTVVQNKIINNGPSTGPFDGNIWINFDPPYKKSKDGPKLPAEWDYVNDVGPGEYDFLAVATHELLHTFGFTSAVSKVGCNTVRCVWGGPTDEPKTNWANYDQFIGNSKSVRAINPGTFTWDPAFDTNLVAGETSPNGLHFTGTNAKAAYGDAVPLYSPNPYRGGSSVSHLADTTAVQLMDSAMKAGVQMPEKLNKVEIGILKDLGYTMATPTSV